MACASGRNELSSSPSFSSNSSEHDLSITCCLPSGCGIQAPINLHEVKITKVF